MDLTLCWLLTMWSLSGFCLVLVMRLRRLRLDACFLW